MTPKVLISDALSPAAVEIFKDRGVEVDFQPNLGKDKEKLAALINGFDGLAIRSATKVSAKILEQAKSLKVIGRAGIGVDNGDVRPLRRSPQRVLGHSGEGVDGNTTFAGGVALHHVAAETTAELLAVPDGGFRTHAEHE